MEKLSKEELKTPDSFYQVGRKGVSWAEGHWVPLVIIIGAIFAIFAGSAIFYQWKSNQNANAQAHLSKAEALLTQWELQPADQKAKTLEEFQKQMSLLKENYGSSEAARLSEGLMGRQAAALQQWDQAISAYEKYAGALPADKKDLAWYPLAIAYEQKGDFANALATYERIVSLKDGLYSSWAHLGKARALRELGRKDEARTTYQSFLEKFPSSPESSEVRGLLNSL